MRETSKKQRETEGGSDFCTKTLGPSIKDAEKGQSKKKRSFCEAVKSPAIF